MQLVLYNSGLLKPSLCVRNRLKYKVLVHQKIEKSKNLTKTKSLHVHDGRLSSERTTT